MCDKNKGYYGQCYYNSEWLENRKLTLPNDWNKALELAKEVEEDKVPKYIKSTDNNSSCYIKGLIYKVIDSSSLHSSELVCNIISNHVEPNKPIWAILEYKGEKYYTPSTEQEYNAQQEEFRKKELLEEAKKKFTKGTRFNNHNIIPWIDQSMEITNTDFYWGYERDKETLLIDLGYGRYSIWLDGKWAEIVEDEFKVGDYVLLSNNAYGWGAGKECHNQIIQIIGINKNNSPEHKGKVKFLFNNSTNYTVYDEIVRLATPSEIEKYKAEHEIEIGGYKAEFKDGKVSFGCKKDITKEDLFAIKRVNEFVNEYNLNLEFESIKKIKINNSFWLDSITLNKLIYKL